MNAFELRPIGHVESTLTRLEDAPRAQHRPNPVGVHRVTVTAVDGNRIRVRHLEALNSTPIVDLKPVLSGETAER